jgi:tetratricopeptide (TPR) repeat protein
MYEGDAEAAIEHLQKALHGAPTDEWTLLNLLSILQRRGRPAEALVLLEPAIPENLATAHVYSRRAALRSQLGRHEDAIRDLAEALRKDPEYPGTEGAIVQELSRVGDPSKVRTDVESLLTELPDLIELRRAWIGTLTESQDWEAASPQLDTYLTLRPQDGRAQLQAGLLALRTQREEEAEAHLIAAAALMDGEPEPYRWLWRLEAGRDNWTGALAAADSLLSRSPTDAEGLWMRGLSLQKAGRTDEAVAVLETLLDAVPGQRSAVLLLSSLLSAREQWTDAARRLGTYLEGEPNDGEALLRRGIALERMGRFEEGTKILERLLTIEPTNHIALNYLGYMWLEKGYRLDDAMAKIQKALELDPGNPAYLDSYGWGYFLRADYDQAISYLEQAVSRGGEHPEIRSHLGQAYEAVGRREDALSQYRKALQYSPMDAELKERVGRLDTSNQRN